MSIVDNFLYKPYVSLNDFSAIMSSFYLNGNLKIAVAVSGGSDSLCLALLLKQWSNISKANITALIVNHGLRKNIEDEIKQVQTWLNNHNITNKVLNVDNKINTKSKVQQCAREARYNTLFKYCEQNSISYLCVAHHFNDLIETISMRKQRSQNIWGDAGISSIKNRGKVLIFRPLLFFSKLALQNTLVKCKQIWVEDPSNENLKFERVVARKQLGKINDESLLQYFREISVSRKKRIKIEQECLKFLINNCKISNLGLIKINLEKLLELDSQIKISVLRLLVKFCTGKDYMPKIAKVINLLEKLELSLHEKGIQKFTIGGTLLIKNSTDMFKNNMDLNEGVALSFVKESRIINYHMQVGVNDNCFLAWDKRFLVNVSRYNFTNYFFAKLSTRAYNYLYDNTCFKELKKKANLTKELLCSLPWLFDNNKKPLIGWMTNLLDGKDIIFSPKNSLFQELFYNFAVAKMSHLD